LPDSLLLSNAEHLHAGLVLYSHPNDVDSHQVRLALAEKRIDYRLIIVDPQQRPEDLAALNPYNSLPTLVDRELRLYNSDVILEYLEDRYRQIRLFSDHPQQRAEQRLLAWRIRQDWLALADVLLRHPDSLNAQDAYHARQQLRDALISLSPLFGHRSFFMSDDMGLCDCLLAPVLWRLPEMQITLPPALSAPLLAYCQRLFTRPAFVASLTDREQQMRRSP
jgi:RNA polymerase-associated protein